MNVIVVGAGLSGLVAASQLQRTGVNVIVLEARNRVGGRVFSLREGLRDGQYADIGAEFIYPQQPLIRNLCAEHGLTLSPAFVFGADPPALLFDGRRLSQDERAAVIGQLRGTYQASPPGSHESVAAWARRNHVSKWGYEFLRGLAQITSLKELRYVDGNELDLEMSWDAELRRIVGGNDRLPTVLAAALDVRLGHVVRVVGWDATGVTVETDADTYRADRAIVAVPGPLTTELGFSPPLPEAKVNASLAMRYGTGMSIAVQYSEGDVLSRCVGTGMFTNRRPGFVISQSLFQSGKPIVLAGLLSRELDPGLMAEEALLTQIDEMMETLANQSVTRVFGCVMDWGRDEFTRCIISGPRGQDRARLAPLIAAPVGNRVFFAGEHTDVRRPPGGMEGAIRSGYRVVNEVLESR